MKCGHAIEIDEHLPPELDVGQPWRLVHGPGGVALYDEPFNPEIGKSMLTKCETVSVQENLVGKRVLLVEDELLIRMWLADEFAEAGFDVVEAEDGDRAMLLIEETPAFDLLITDIQMPGRTDGNAVAIRAKQRYPGLSVIYASGRPGSLKNTIGCCDAFIPKPFSAAYLLATARRLLDAERDTIVLHS